MPVSPAPPDAASVPSPIITGRVWTAAQWIAAWETKSDYNDAVTGGTIDSVPIGATTRSTGAFTTLAANGAVTFTGASTGLAVTNNATVGGTLGVTGAATLTAGLTVNNGGTNPWQFTGTTLQMTGTGNPTAFIKVPNAGSFAFQVNSATVLSMNANTVTSTANLTASATLQSNRTMQSGYAPTYAAGSAITTTGPNYPIFWFDNAITGTINSGGGAPNFFRSRDTVVLSSPATTLLPLLNLEQQLNAGYDGNRNTFVINQNKNSASVSGGSVSDVVSFFAHWNGNEGGTSALGGGSGGGTLLNVDLNCNMPYANHAVVSEFDMRLRDNAHYKRILQINWGIGDAYHGLIQDVGMSFTASNTIAPGTGRGLVMIEVGGYSPGWPLDPSAVGVGAGTALFRTVLNGAGNVASGGVTTPYVPEATYGFDLRGSNYTQYAWRSSGLGITGSGQIEVGPGMVDFDATGLILSATKLTEQTAVVSVAGTGYNNGDYLMDDVGGIWVATTVAAASNAAVATLTLKRAGFRASVPGAAVAMSGGFGKNCTATITSSSAASAVTIPSGTNLTINASGPTVRAGTGAASGTQPKGSMWMRTDGGVGTTLYVSQGAGTWNAVAGV